MSRARSRFHLRAARYGGHVALAAGPTPSARRALGLRPCAGRDSFAAAEGGTSRLASNVPSRLRAVVMAVVIFAAPAAAQSPAPAPVTFDEAIRRATTANPSVAIAAANILRAEALLGQARAATLPAIAVQGSNVTLDGVREVDGDAVTSRNTVAASIPVSMPLFAPALWARRAQAGDQQRIAQASADDVRRQVAFATAQAYLAVIAAHRVVEAQQRSRDTAQAFFDYANERLKAGASSRLNALRAQQTLSADEALVEQAMLSRYRTQEALGVLMAVEGPVDAVAEPAFDIPPQAAAAAGAAMDLRTDLKLFGLELEAAERVLRDSSKEWYPVLNGIFEPAFQYPGSVFTPESSWRALLQFSVPLFDSGLRSSRRLERQAFVQQAEATLSAARRDADAEIREAYETARRTERVLERTREAATQAAQVLEITNISFRAGATTNIEVIDAQRRARDADTAVAVAEDNVRQARLALLNALGRFP
jgi:outer membrane protein TolC